MEMEGCYMRIRQFSANLGAALSDFSVLVPALNFSPGSAAERSAAVRRKGFAGWYFKHQRGGDMVSFIPGSAESGAFIQMITPSGSRQFDVPNLAAFGDSVCAGKCLFAPSGCKIRLPDVSGEIRYGNLTPLRTDIMGPFRFLPMECRHGVVSMAHTLSGGITIDGRRHSFDGGMGYIEKDSGTSFPRFYQWLQCNDFAEPCALMVSIAHIPLGGVSFTGCICAIVYRGQEYRLATYSGVKVFTSDETHICLGQGKLLLEIEITPVRESHALRSPVEGKMAGIVKESMDAGVHARLWERGQLVFDLASPHAAYEYVPPKDEMP
jgi:tocopherol cyclase